MDVLLRSEISCILVSAVFNLFTWYCYISAKSHKLAFMQDGYMYLITLYYAGIQSANSGLLFMPSKMKRSCRKFYIPCLICLQKYSTIWYLNKNTPNQLKLQCGASLPVFLWSKDASAEEVTTGCCRKLITAWSGIEKSIHPSCRLV